MKLVTQLKNNIKKFNPFKFNSEESFGSENFHIFVETGNVEPREDKSYCLIGYFEDDQIDFTDILSNKTSRTHNLYHVSFNKRNFEYVTFTGESNIENEKSLKYTAKFNGSYLNGETIDAFYNLKEIPGNGLRQEIICDYPRIIDAITKMENNQRFTKSDIIKLATEINYLVERKLAKEKSDKNNQMSNQ